jgi:DNA-binding MarR family transcriptional regulator
MNAIFFGLKRAFHGTLRITRRTLARVGLTAARFDLMYAVHEDGEQGTFQRDLRDTLGVSAPTVSRMLASLEELGLVRRKPLMGDRRHRLVTLTQTGRRCIRRAIRLFIRSGRIQLAVDSALCPDGWHDEMASLFAMSDCDGMLQRVRDAYGDIAALYYRWHPDD